MLMANDTTRVSEAKGFQRMFASGRLTLGVFFPIEALEGDEPSMRGQERLARRAEELGAWGDYMLVPASYVARARASLELTRAGAVPIVGLTAHETLTDILGVHQGDVVLITAAAGGVGHLAVQIATGLGAHVVATASGRNHDFVRAAHRSTVSCVLELLLGNQTRKSKCTKCRTFFQNKYESTHRRRLWRDRSTGDTKIDCPGSSGNRHGAHG